MIRRHRKLRRFLDHIHFSITESNEVEFYETPGVERETILRLNVDQAEKFANMILELAKQIRENPARKKNDE